MVPERIPRRLPDRLTYFEVLWWLLYADAVATIDELGDSGWSREAVARNMQTYTDWIAGNVEHAIEMAIFMAGTEAAA